MFIHTAGLGDLIYTLKLICNLEKIEDYNFILMIKEEHKGLFDDYKGNFRLIFLKYDHYRFNFFYRLQIIKILRSYSFIKVFQLNHNRRIIDDDLAIHSGGKQIIALNRVEKQYPKIFKRKLDKYYDRIIFDNTLDIGTKMDLF